MGDKIFDAGNMPRGKVYPCRAGRNQSSFGQCSAKRLGDWISSSSMFDNGLIRLVSDWSSMIGMATRCVHGQQQFGG